MKKTSVSLHYMCHLSREKVGEWTQGAHLGTAHGRDMGRECGISVSW